MCAEWWKSLEKDPPFNLHVVRKEEDASFVVGDSASYYVKEFEKLLNDIDDEGRITTVAGDPGTGKSFMIVHLQYRMKHDKGFLGIPAVIRLFGRSYSVEHISARILNSDEFDAFCESFGVHVRKTAEEGPLVNLRLLKQACEQIRQKGCVDPLCVFLDNIDEYVRFNGEQIRMLKGIDDKLAKRKALLNLLRIVDAFCDSLPYPCCVVLSFTRDVVLLMGDEDRFVESVSTSLKGVSSTFADRFKPIRQKDDPSKLLQFGGITLEEAFELVERNMNVWFTRHPEIDRSVEPACQAESKNLFPFTIESVKMLHAASQYPGEIAFGCLAAILRYADLQYENERRPREQKLDIPNVIERPVMAMGILQMSNYFRNVYDNEIRKEELRDTVASNPLALYTYLLPQEIEKQTLRNPNLVAGLGEAFQNFLSNILAERIRQIQTNPHFYNSRGQMRYPQFAQIDSVFEFDLKRIGVQFIEEGLIDSEDDKFKSGCLAITGHGQKDVPTEDQMHAIVYVCLSSEETSDLFKMTCDCIDSSSGTYGFITLQNRDRRPRASVVCVDPSTAWAWKAVDGCKDLDIGKRRTLSFLMETIHCALWIEGPDGVDRSIKNTEWLEFLKQLTKNDDVLPPPIEREMPDMRLHEQP